jgi:predicted Zn-dependent protease
MAQQGEQPGVPLQNTNVGTLETALAHATRLLGTRPDLAAQQAQEILKAVPGSPHARLLLGQAMRATGDAAAAVDVLAALAREQPRSAATRFELGLAYGASGQLDQAIESLQAATELKPEWPDAWRVLSEYLDASGDMRRAELARSAFLTSAVHDPQLRSAANALRANELDQAEALLRAHLQKSPRDFAALRMLAEIATRLRRFVDAQTILETCLEIAPNFAPAMHQYAVVLYRLTKTESALEIVERLLAAEPNNLSYLALQGAILAHMGDTEDSIRVYEKVLKRSPTQAKIWLSYGHALKAAGRAEECIGAYKSAIEKAPGLGEAYWSLANMKTYRFGESDVESIRSELKRSTLNDDDRLHLEYALGKALEDRKEYEDSLRHYAAGARIRRRLHPYNATETAAHVRRCRAYFTQQLLSARANKGAPDADPIFILGMPRAGSTLVEQILASHPLVEGTMELPNIPAFAREIADVRAGEGTKFPEAIDELSDDDLRGFGERFLHETRVYRKSGTPYFIDKMPNNFLYVGLIHLILPNAKIIDARRHPMACCFSNFKQHFARGQNFSYSFEDMAHFYRHYVALMDHFDQVLPGRVHRVIYERMVEDPESEVRKLLAYCGLEFDERCLRFYENDRAVRTASSEQVRQPIFRSGVDQWRHYEPWLDTLKEALGPALDSYPDTRPVQ